MKKDDGIEDDCDIEGTPPAHLRAFTLRRSDRNLKNFIGEINSFYKNSKYYGDTDSLYIEKKYWDMLDKANLVGEEL